ncbi:MAG: CDP-glycerol glycerophosphotransferase family protein [Chloroflexota bacterium]
MSLAAPISSIEADRAVNGARPAARGRGRTVFLCIPSGTPAANILRTGVFSAIRDDESVGTIVILSPLVSEPHFVEEHAGPKIRFEPLIQHEPGWLERRFIRVMQERYVKTMPTSSMRIRVAKAARAEQEVRYLDRTPLSARSKGFRRLAVSGLKSLPIPIDYWFRASDLCTLGARYAEVFATYRPSLLVTPTTGLYFGEGPLMARADRLGVPSVAIDLSWDHFTTKTAPLRRVHGLSVWNGLMKREAMHLHGYRDHQVTVTGVPQFDIYAEKRQLGTREQFLERVGAHPGRKLITLTTIPPVLFRNHPDVIETLVRAIENDELDVPAQLLVRVHPRDDVSQYERFMRHPLVVIEKPFRETIVAEGSNVDPSLADRLHLGATLYHSDVIVNVASTIAIEAAIMDTPIVNIAYDGAEQRDYLESTRRYYDYTHFRPLVNARATRLARSPENLVNEVRSYLQQPARDRDGRARAMEQLCYRVDGSSGERVADFVLRTLASVH